MMNAMEMIRMLPALASKECVKAASNGAAVQAKLPRVSMQMLEVAKNCAKATGHLRSTYVPIEAVKACSAFRGAENALRALYK